MPPSICPDAVNGFTITPEVNRHHEPFHRYLSRLGVDGYLRELRRKRRGRGRRNVGADAHDLFLVISMQRIQGNFLKTDAASVGCDRAAVGKPDIARLGHAENPRSADSDSPGGLFSRSHRSRAGNVGCGRSVRTLVKWSEVRVG